MKNLCKIICVLLIGIIILFFAYSRQGYTNELENEKKAQGGCADTKLKYRTRIRDEMMPQHNYAGHEIEQNKMGKKDQFLCVEVEDGYEVILYNHSNEIIFSDIFFKEPGIHWVTDDILEISYSVGSPATYAYYFDTKNLYISDIYFNPIIVGDSYIAYMENHEELILRDIFNKGLLEMRIRRNFAQTANPISAVRDIEMIDSENIVVTYFVEPDYTEISEQIKLENAF